MQVKWSTNLLTSANLLTSTNQRGTKLLTNLLTNLRFVLVLVLVLVLVRFALFVHSNEKALNLLTNLGFVLVKDATLKTSTKPIQIFDLCLQQSF